MGHTLPLSPVSGEFSGTDHVRGIDVSHWQGPVGWARVAAEAGLHFVFLKATDGVHGDVRFRENSEGAEAAGLLHGAYHLFRPAESPVVQADTFLHVVRPSLAPRELPPVLDVEDRGGLPPREVAKRLRIWLSMVARAALRVPIIYTRASFWDASVGSYPEFSRCPLWVAHYGSMASPALPKGWAGWTFWQFSDQGRVPGIAGPVDLNRFNGSLADLTRLCGL